MNDKTDTPANSGGQRAFYSLAEAFQRGIYESEHPSNHTSVGYHLRIYPEFFVEVSKALQAELEELSKKKPFREHPEQHQLEVEAINLKYPLQLEVIGWRVSADYTNEETREIIHRFELVRATREELVAALFEMPLEIKHPRQRSVYRKMLKEHFARPQGSSAWQAKGGTDAFHP
jgi:hypothetical protein